MNQPYFESDMAIQKQTPQFANGIRWRLGDILPAHSGKLFTSITEQLEAMLVGFESARSELKDGISPARFLELLQDYEQIIRVRSRLGGYAYLYFSEDTRLQDARIFKARIEEVDTDAANRTLFFDLWWKALPAEASKELADASGGFAYFLERLQKTKQYALSEPVEQAINLKDSTGRSTLLQLFHQVVDSFAYELTIREETRKYTEEELRDLFYSQDRAMRRTAYVKVMRRRWESRDVLGEIYQALVRDWRNEGIKLRKYASPISIRNVGNDVPDAAVDTLLNVCVENMAVFQRFFRLKAKLLSISDFSRYDIYAPILREKEKTYTWDEATRMVLGTFESFHPEFSAMAKNLLVQSHIDAEPRAGKMGGAYCMSVTPETTPYVLLSYNGRARSVATLAHELGHAVHGQLSGRRNNTLTFEAPLPLAETASVFGELLLTDKLMTEADEQTSRSLLLSMLDDSYATIGRQSSFVLFEREAHEQISKGIGVDDLCKVYFENLRTQFGSSMALDEDFRSEWLGIPHLFQSPFYCYAYAWGNLLVLALYKQFKKEGARTFAPRYMKLLSYGGSASPERILSEAGFDVRSRAFWQSGFDELSSSVSKLESLT